MIYNPVKTRSEMPDEKLIQFYLSSNPPALAALADLYKDRIYGAVFSVVQDRVAAEEIIGEVFNCLIDRQLTGSSPEEGHFLEWSFAVAREVSIEWLRKNARPLPADEDNRVNITAPRSMLCAEFHDRMKSMISILPEPQREVITLNHYMGLSFREIATRMCCSVTTALDYMRAGLANLKLLMTEQEVLLH